MPEKLHSLINAADYIGVMSLYGIAIAFGGIGGFCGTSIILLRMGGITKLKKGLSLILALGIAGALCSLMVFTGILTYEVFSGKEVLDSIEAVSHMSVFTGFFTSIFMMLANRGITHVSLKYGKASLELDLNDPEPVRVKVDD